MKKGYILFEDEKLSEHEFLDKQMIFINDMEIVCHWFHNILDHEIKKSDNFINNLKILHKKISQRYDIAGKLSDKIAWKQEILKKLSQILENISWMIPKEKQVVKI